MKQLSSLSIIPKFVQELEYINKFSEVQTFPPTQHNRDERERVKQKPIENLTFSVHRKLHH